MKQKKKIGQIYKINGFLPSGKWDWCFCGATLLLLCRHDPKKIPGFCYEWRELSSNFWLRDHWISDQNPPRFRSAANISNNNVNAFQTILFLFFFLPFYKKREKGSALSKTDYQTLEYIPFRYIFPCNCFLKEREKIFLNDVQCVSLSFSFSFISWQYFSTKSLRHFWSNHKSVTALLVLIGLLSTLN